jgi:hypothetical protein
MTLERVLLVLAVWMVAAMLLAVGLGQWFRGRGRL